MATSLFGSLDNMLKINLRTPTASEACEELENVLKDREKVVVLVERVDLADDRFMKLLIDRFEAGNSEDLDEFQEKKSQIIFLLTREDDECVENEHFVIPMVLKCNKSSSGLVNNKRKPEFDVAPTMIKKKNPRIEEEEEEGNVACDISNIKKEFSRQLSFGANALDLNLRVDTEEEEEEEESAAKPAIQLSSGFEERFLESIQNRFDLTVLSNEDITKFFMAKIQASCEEILGHREERFGFTIDAELVDKFYEGFGFFANGLFEEWVKEVLQTGLLTVKNGGKEGISVINLCLGGIDMIDQGEVYEDEGFMGTCLPKRIQVSFVD